MLTFAMSLMILLVFKRSTKVSEKSDMTKSWATFCCSGTYKKNQTKVLRNLGNYKGLFDYVNPRTNDSTKDKGNYTSMDKVYFHWFDFIPFL